MSTEVDPPREIQVVVTKPDEEDQSTTSSEYVEVRMEPPSNSMFRSTLGSVMSCLGSAVGTGNIWRFPRILASQSYSRGALCFYLVWGLVLFLWSVPVILVEYALGRFTRNSPLPAFRKFLGKYFIWVGGWITSVVLLIGAYYPVVVGWCLYYLFVSCTAKTLPETEAAGLELFNDFAKNSYWPIFFQLLTIAIAGIFLFGGIRFIEIANLFLVPVLLIILIFTFGWSMTRQYAELAIVFLFTPAWSTLSNPSLFISAAAQNAFDTGAGLGTLFAYGARMPREAPIVRYSFMIPVLNNIVSLYTSFAIFSTVFSTLIQNEPTMTISEILRIMQDAGPGSTGLTFTWIPVLFSKVGIPGRIMCVLFFLCLFFAGISSLLAVLQVGVLCLEELTSHYKAVVIVLVCCALFGLPSAMKLEVLENQDNTWGTALLVSGLCFAVVPIAYRPWRFRRIIINEFCPTDWQVPFVWILLIMLVVPGSCITLIAWWIYSYVSKTPEWYRLTLDSVSLSLVLWATLVVILIATNLICVWRYGDVYEKARKKGSDPYDPATYLEEKEQIPMSELQEKETPETDVITEF